MTAYLSDRQLDAIVLRYQDMVYRIAALRMRHQADAEDVFQEVFIRLVRHAGKLRSEEHIKAWLIRVTINCCNSLHADAFRNKTVPYDDGLEKSGDSEDEDAQWTTAPALMAEDEYGEDGDGSLMEAVKRLPPAYRDVIYLFYYEELPVRRIADILGASEGAIKTRLSRARSILKDRLTEVTER